MEMTQFRKNKKSNTKSSTKSRGRGGSRNGGQSSNHTGPDTSMVIIRHKTVEKVVKRSFGFAGGIPSTAGGQITLNTVSCSGLITALGTEFTNFAQEFQEYRVTKITSHFLPSTTSATSTTGPYQGGLLVTGWKQFIPVNINTLQQNPEKVLFSTLFEKKVQVTSNGFPNGKLWTTYGIAIVADRDFGLVWTNLGTLAASSNIFVTNFEMECEFRIAQ